MPPCEMCGRERELLRALVEDIQMSVCDACSKYGKVLGKAVTSLPKKEKKRVEEPLEAVVEGYSSLIRQKREKLGLKQKELAKKISEKESVLHKIERGKMEPSIELARKLEKFLHIQLIEIREDEAITAKGRSGTVTIGDVFKIRKR